MILTITEFKKDFENYINSLVKREINEIILTKNGKEIVKVSIYLNKISKRIGSAKKEMEGFDISLENFNAIGIQDCIDTSCFEYS